MPRSAPVPRDCRCGAVPGALHRTGCDKERCAICGGQIISCGCVHEISGVEEVDEPTEEMWKKYDEEVARLGGPLPWDGEFPGSKEARAFGLWCQMVPGRGWVPCEEDAPDATEDLNRLHRVVQWDRQGRRWVRRSN